jgi:periplasmic protein TonB
VVHEKKACPRCQREIDAFSRICPFCNHEQHLPRDAQSAAATIPLNFPPPAESGDKRPPVEAPLSRRLRGSRILAIVGGVAVLVAAFAVGAFVNQLGTRDRLTRSSRQPRAIETAQPAESPAPRSRVAADLRLVPVEGGGEVITSAPLPEMDATLPAEAQRTDATALPSTEYSRILASAQSAPTPHSGIIDPRALPPGLGTLQQPRPAATAPPTPRPAESRPAAAPEPVSEERREVRSGRRTHPVPTSQPIPQIRNLREGGTIRLKLTVTAEGRVSDVQVIEALQGATPQVISAVQRWRFKPATLDGEPVQGTFDVDISFNP